MRLPLETSPNESAGGILYYMRCPGFQDDARKENSPPLDYYFVSEFSYEKDILLLGGLT